jgi:hypothetical protein
VSRGISLAILGINQHCPLVRLTPSPLPRIKKTWRINKEMKTNTQQSGWEFWKPTREGGRSKEMIEGLMAGGWQASAWGRPGSIPQWSSPEPVSSIQAKMTLKNWRTKREWSQYADSRGLADVSLILPQRKGERQRKKPLVINPSKNSTPKQESWWITHMISATWRPHANLNCHTSLRQKLTKQMVMKDRKKLTTQPRGDYGRASA